MMSPTHLPAPEDVLEEVMFFPGAGGMQKDCRFDYEKPTMAYGQLSLELTDTLFMLTCGWPHDELIKITMIFPDGHQVSEVRQVEWEKRRDATSWDPGVVYTYTTDLEDLPGTYTVIQEGDSGRVEHIFEIVKPEEARLRQYVRDRSLLLYGFAPKERVRLFAYEVTADESGCSLVAWREYQVDSRGQLVVQVEGSQETQPWPSCGFIALGDAAGEVLPRDVTPPKTGEYIQKLSYVVADTGTDFLEIWTNYSSEWVVVRVDSGTRLEVLESQRSYVGLWWHVRLADGTEGWVNDEDVKRVVE